MTGRRRVVALAAIVVLTACGAGDGTAGDRLPDVEIVSLTDGSTSSLADLDVPAVVNLWATWCPPCRREIPDFEAVHQARGDEITFVGINVGEDGDRAAAYLADVGVSYDQYLDPQGYVATELETSAMPVTLVVDPSGAVVTRHLGPMDQGELDEAIDAALGR